MSQLIKDKALELGYLACGIIPAAEFFEYHRILDERIEAFPDSKNLYKRFHKLSRLPDAGKSIVVCTCSFSDYLTPDSLDGRIGKTYLFDSRIPYSFEYRARKEFEAFLGTLGIGVLEGNVPARFVAAKAGLGKFGYNNFLYCEDHGSNIWIDTWIVDIELDYDDIPKNLYLHECSDSCRRCVDACPTGALADSFSMDMGKCITHLQFEDEVLDEALWSQMGEWLYGCDACQDVCPLNMGLPKGANAFPLLSEFEELLKLESVLDIDEEVYVKILNPRFWYANECGSWLWKRNALLNMINSGDSKYRRLIERCCSHDDARLREIAQWGCRG